MYVNGVDQDPLDVVETGGPPSMRFSNDDPLLIGAHGLSASDPGSSTLRFFENKTGFVEI